MREVVLDKSLEGEPVAGTLERGKTLLDKVREGKTTLSKVRELFLDTYIDAGSSLSTVAL